MPILKYLETHTYTCDCMTWKAFAGILTGAESVLAGSGAYTELKTATTDVFRSTPQGVAQPEALANHTTIQYQLQSLNFNNPSLQAFQHWIYQQGMIHMHTAIIGFSVAAALAVTTAALLVVEIKEKKRA